MPALSGAPPRQFYSGTPQAVKPAPFTPVSQPVRQSVVNGHVVVERLDSSPTARAGSTTGGTSVVIIGSSQDSANRDARLQSAVDDNNRSGGTVTSSDAQANADAVAARKKGVLGCIKSPSTSEAGCGECDTISCLEKLLAGNLLDADAKSLLCGMMSAAERAAKSQIDSAGNSLLRAANDLTSANALKAPLNTLASFVNKLDPGAVANCFGAQQLKDIINGKLKDASRVISNAEKGVHDKIAQVFNKATASAQQFSITPPQCNDGSSATLRGLL